MPGQHKLSHDDIDVDTLHTTIEGGRLFTPTNSSTPKEDSGCPTTDAKYAVGGKYCRVRRDLWVTTKEGSVEEVPGVGVFGGDDVGPPSRCEGSCTWAMG